VRSFTIFLLLLVHLSGCVEHDVPDHSISASLMLSEINNVRVKGCKCGSDALPPVHELKPDRILLEAANSHANDMHQREYFGHISPEGSSPVSRAQRAGYTGQYVGENIARGYKPASEVVAAWVQSESHCRALMDPLYSEAGAARVGDYWVLDLGKPLD
jgi:uncharacterized protein YkwD